MFTNPPRQHLLTKWIVVGSVVWLDIEASARKHGVSDEDMLHHYDIIGEPSKSTIRR